MQGTLPPLSPRQGAELLEWLFGALIAQGGLIVTLVQRSMIELIPYAKHQRPMANAADFRDAGQAGNLMERILDPRCRRPCCTRASGPRGACRSAPCPDRDRGAPTGRRRTPRCPADHRTDRDSRTGCSAGTGTCFRGRDRKAQRRQVAQLRLVVCGVNVYLSRLASYPKAQQGFHAHEAPTQHHGSNHRSIPARCMPPTTTGLPLQG